MTYLPVIGCTVCHATYWGGNDEQNQRWMRDHDNECGVTDV